MKQLVFKIRNILNNRILAFFKTNLYQILKIQLIYWMEMYSIMYKYVSFKESKESSYKVQQDTLQDSGFNLKYYKYFLLKEICKKTFF